MCVQKEAVSVAEMARMVGLSRARFYELHRHRLPLPLYDMATRRPFYPPELQEACLEVRQRNSASTASRCCSTGERKEVVQASESGRDESQPDDNRYRDLMDGLRSLGLAGVTAAQVRGGVEGTSYLGHGPGRGIESRVPAPQGAGCISLSQGAMLWTKTTTRTA